MKIILIALLGISVLSSCREESLGGEPQVFYDYFKIVDASTGEDYFLANPDEDPENLHVYWRDRSGNFVISNEVIYRSVNKSFIFGPLFFTDDPENVYQLKFPNGDIDTIQVEATGDGDFDDIFSFYYNSRLTDVFDFTDDEFRSSYRANIPFDNNGVRTDLPNENTIVVKFEK
jgi:hypothetical protein